jgi:exonuclease VII small subunit
MFLRMGPLCGPDPAAMEFESTTAELDLLVEQLDLRVVDLDLAMAEVTTVAQG